MFDPFCRHERIDFHGISTTVGQLNFFAWAIEDEILDYMKERMNDIHADMETRMTSTTKSGGAAGRKKRHELSHSATKSIKKHDVKIMVTFK
jgi:hypothetical protein